MNIMLFFYFLFKGALLVKKEEYHVPPRRLWFPNIEKCHIVDETFDYQKKRLKWSWGPEVSETYAYDQEGRITSISIPGSINKTYSRPR